MICLDSTFLIDFLKKPLASRATELLGEEEAVTTEINVHEVLVGTFLHANPSKVERQRFLLNGLLSGMRVLPLERMGAERAAQIAASLIRQGKKIDVTDVLIAGIMQAHSCTRILTRNVSDFRKIDELDVISY